MRDCDFITPEYHQQRRMVQIIRQRVCLMGGMVVLILVWCIAHQGQVNSASAMMIEVQQQDEQLQLHLQQKQALEDERVRLERRELLVDVLSSPTQLGVIFADVSRRVPRSMLLTQVRVKSPGMMYYVGAPEIAPVEKIAAKPGTAPIVVDGPKPTDPPRMTISGLARRPQDVIAFAAALERSTLLDRVQIQSQGPTQWAGRTGEKFEITCELLDQKETP